MGGEERVDCAALEGRTLTIHFRRQHLQAGREIKEFLPVTPPDFSLEAKCYAPGIRGMTANTIGVKEVSRLISRIRHYNATSVPLASGLRGRPTEHNFFLNRHHRLPVAHPEVLQTRSCRFWNRIFLTPLPSVSFLGSIS
jgi:hypothetical protein